MGCVLGKNTSVDLWSRSVPTAPRRRRKSDEPARDSEASFRFAGARKELTARRRSAGDLRRDAPKDVEEAEERSPRPPLFLKKNQQQVWPPWLMAVAGDAIRDWTPRRANSFEKLDKIGQGTYSNVYKARDLETGKIVALKKVRFDDLEPESVKFMAREILVLRKLDHPNILKLEGLAASRLSSSLYLIFEYMEHDLAGLAASQGGQFSLPQIKCYMKQLLSGLEHCHNNGVLHRDIKGSNLLINNEGTLKIADFGLATFFDLDRKVSMTSRVVTLWYRPPELLLGAIYYGVGVDLWSAGCILAELLAGQPIMPGRTEVEQLHKIFKLCGSPCEEYWKNFKLPNATLFKPRHLYKRCIAETFKEFPSVSLPLIETLLSIDPNERGTSTAALNSEFFTTEPFACEPSSLPKYSPSKEMDVKLREEEARRQKGVNVKFIVSDRVRRVRNQNRASRAVPAPEANAEIPANLDFFTTEPYACEPSSLPKYLPSKEMDVKLREEEARRQKGVSVKFTVSDGVRRVRNRDRASRAVLAPEANAEIPANLDRWRVVSQANAKSKSEKFPPPHQDAAVGHLVDGSHLGPMLLGASDTSFGSTMSNSKSSGYIKDAGSLGGPSSRRMNKENPHIDPSRKLMRTFYPSSLRLSLNLLSKGKSEIFGGRRLRK